MVSPLSLHRGNFSVELGETKFCGLSGMEPQGKIMKD